MSHEVLAPVVGGGRAAARGGSVGAVAENGAGVGSHRDPDAHKAPCCPDSHGDAVARRTSPHVGPWPVVPYTDTPRYSERGPDSYCPPWADPEPYPTTVRRAVGRTIATTAIAEFGVPDSAPLGPSPEPNGSVVRLADGGDVGAARHDEAGGDDRAEVGGDAARVQGVQGGRVPPLVSDDEVFSLGGTE